jgi:hypothetical protein
MNYLIVRFLFFANMKNELRKWGKNGRQMFLDDKTYFENMMEKFIGSRL